MLNAGEQKWMLVLNQRLEGLVTTRAAAVLLRRSTRQVKRLKAAYRRASSCPLVRRNQGRHW